MKRKLFTLLLAFMLVCTLASCGLAVPRPEIKEGSFDFSITYEIKGEIKTFSATYECKFDGTSWSIEGGNSSRDWADNLVADHEGDDYSAIVGTTDDGGSIILFFGIYPEYFMGDSTGDRGAPEPQIYVTYPEDEHGATTLVADPLEVEEIYGAKIISYEYDAPVENTFTLFDFN